MTLQRFSNKLSTGFTLIEVVVALTLLTLIVLGLLGALRSLGETGERLEAQALVNDDLRLVSALLRRTIASASPALRTAQDAKEQGVWFRGGAQALQWLGILPARHGVGGLMHLRLQLEPDAGEDQRLVLFMAAYRGPDKAPDWEAFEPRILLDGITHIQIRYLGVGEASWSDQWENEPVLPDKLYLALSVRGRPWPPLVISLFNTADQPRPGATVIEPLPIGLPDL
ncbi:hypothetical protein B4966_12875 [Rhodocyclaceae bacterium]|nr:hypothetical protein B4966_12875 [Rhodocyclaceae bacterium]